ncbi:ArsR/SmtB family transcription factor [Actinomadura litoris]|uniref:ArsR/SmtB family transcription factor n=1 Tax=Actinomadura litoris TaxID=2678616 RepID=UPI001FA6BC41|nr:winged helix-turn-helix domain-containing protein [Actinomadura litoris]
MAVWEAPVLSLSDHPSDRDVHLDGRGLILVPSFFCWRAPTTLMDPHGPQVIVYPVVHDLGWLTGGHARTRPLQSLVGRTRATVMATLAEEPATTTELARRARISLASASEHATVLRHAGLLVSRRTGNRVQHVLTDLGTRLLEGTPET